MKKGVEGARPACLYGGSTARSQAFSTSEVGSGWKRRPDICATLNSSSSLDSKDFVPRSHPPSPESSEPRCEANSGRNLQKCGIRTSYAVCQARLLPAAWHRILVQKPMGQKYLCGCEMSTSVTKVAHSKSASGLRSVIPEPHGCSSQISLTRNCGDDRSWGGMPTTPAR
jgi:hypothetical protein